MRITALLPALVVFSLPFPAQGFHGIPLWKVITGRVRRGSPAPDPTPDREFTPKFCYQCRHYSPPNIRDSGPDFGRCLSDPQDSEMDMQISLFRVTGTVPVFPSKHESKYEYCMVTRSDENKCGPDAEWFEPRS